MKVGVISLATAHMRLIYGRVNEGISVDCSHKTNKYFVLVCTGLMLDLTRFFHGCSYRYNYQPFTFTGTEGQYKDAHDS